MIRNDDPKLDDALDADALRDGRADDDYLYELEIQRERAEQRRALKDPDERFCRFCGSRKEPHHLCCASCWKRLPQEYHVLFALAKIRCRKWLREHPPTSPS